MKHRLVSLALLVALLGALMVAPLTRGAAAQSSASTFAGIPISGTIEGVSSFVGTFTVERFAVQGGQLVAIGTLTGELTNLLTREVQQVSQRITLPVSASGTCEILDLTLGPLDFDLLGLQVHLDQVHLTITAEQGPGNLLGNLLCAIAGLLDNPGGNLNGIANLLNRILRLLG